jgi:hypothetical protein
MDSPTERMPIACVHCAKAKAKCDKKVSLLSCFSTFDVWTRRTDRAVGWLFKSTVCMDGLRGSLGERGNRLAVRHCDETELISGMTRLHCHSTTTVGRLGMNLLSRPKTPLTMLSEPSSRCIMHSLTGGGYRFLALDASANRSFASPERPEGHPTTQIDEMGHHDPIRSEL